MRKYFKCATSKPSQQYVNRVQETQITHITMLHYKLEDVTGLRLLIRAMASSRMLLTQGDPDVCAFSWYHLPAYQSHHISRISLKWTF